MAATGDLGRATLLVHIPLREEEASEGTCPIQQLAGVGLTDLELWTDLQEHSGVVRESLAFCCSPPHPKSPP